MLRLINSFLLFSCISLSMAVISTDTNANPNEQIPDDIRYMLEDLYGANKNEWPSIKKEDLNKDGSLDWLAKKNRCNKKNNCPVDVFICIPGKKSECSEYCYMEVKTLTNIEEDLKILKCETTC